MAERILPGHGVALSVTAAYLAFTGYCTNTYFGVLDYGNGNE